ncbi:MarR family winged helix-turn-helix transcriptional regulator [Actinacidiphila sp. ITFR-21]|uniref:MarR family winged helix-turn-helix transcriptional regulator n=1 Tax=Actinacidiphila sp. ITFR-21 TaxID=3075199 RepID=UPI00288A9895|nr:MarR family transcriptional regulator [Streptomyces sp. ITFR-21]WNI18972.1 MarR family transcriptional regulator [Streptomyces sp. ITFR-21]
MLTGASSDRDGAAFAAREVVELLEVLWTQDRDMTSTAPVSSSQLKVLYVLDRDEGINLRTLGEVLGSAPSSVSRMCDRLHALGFIERSLSTASRRELELRLSGRGESYLAELRARREASLLHFISAMSPADRAALVAGLNGFRSAVTGPAPAESGPRTGAAESA